MAYKTIQQVNSAKPKNSRITAIKILGSRPNKKGKREVWVTCICSCGSPPKDMRVSHAVRVMSCGCLLIETNMLSTPSKYKTIEDVIKNKPKDSWLTPIEILKRPNDIGQIEINCICDCGKHTVTRISSFVSGKCRSCGCLGDISKKRKKYPGNNYKIYCVYRAMRNRCLLPTNKYFKNYGAKGVKICKEWLDNYQNFLDWALSNGWQIGLEIDKDIKYKEKFPESKRGLLYSPEFCQFVTHEENNNTKSTTRYFNYNGELKTANQISKITGIPSKEIYRKFYSENKLI